MCVYMYVCMCVFNNHGIVIKHLNFLTVLTSNIQVFKTMNIKSFAVAERNFLRSNNENNLNIDYYVLNK